MALYTGLSSGAMASLIFPVCASLYAWNTATLVLLAWIFVACLNGVVNARAEVFTSTFCTTSMVFNQAAMIGVPSAALAINRRLYTILSGAAQGLTVPLRARRRMVVVDLAHCILPLVYLAILPNFYQKRKFAVFEGIGCVPALSSNSSTYIIIYGPPIIVVLWAFHYALLAVVTAVAQKEKIQQWFAEYTGLDQHQYFKTVAFVNGGLLVAFAPSILLNIVTLRTRETFINAANGAMVPGEIWNANSAVQIALEYSRWTQGPVFAYFAVGLLGLGKQPFSAYQRLTNGVANGARQFIHQHRRPPALVLPLSLEMNDLVSQDTTAHVAPAPPQTARLPAERRGSPGWSSKIGPVVPPPSSKHISLQIATYKAAASPAVWPPPFHGPPEVATADWDKGCLTRHQPFTGSQENEDGSFRIYTWRDEYTGRIRLGPPLRTRWDHTRLTGFELDGRYNDDWVIWEGDQYHVGYFQTLPAEW